MAVAKIPADRPARRRIAIAIAAAADAVQLGIFPVFLPGLSSPLDDVIDVVVGALMVFLLGWHIAFLPAFVVEILPVADLFPTWTIAALYVTRARQG